MKKKKPINQFEITKKTVFPIFENIFKLSKYTYRTTGVTVNKISQ